MDIIPIIFLFNYSADAVSLVWRGCLVTVASMELPGCGVGGSACCAATIAYDVSSNSFYTFLSSPKYFKVFCL